MMAVAVAVGLKSSNISFAEENLEREAVGKAFRDGTLEIRGLIKDFKGSYNDGVRSVPKDLAEKFRRINGHAIRVSAKESFEYRPGPSTKKIADSLLELQIRFEREDEVTGSDWMDYKLWSGFYAISSLQFNEGFWAAQRAFDRLGRAMNMRYGFEAYPPIGEHPLNTFPPDTAEEWKLTRDQKIAKALPLFEKAVLKFDESWENQKTWMKVSDELGRISFLQMALDLNNGIDLALEDLYFSKENALLRDFSVESIRSVADSLKDSASLSPEHWVRIIQIEYLLSKLKRHGRLEDFEKLSSEVLSLRELVERKAGRNISKTLLEYL